MESTRSACSLLLLTMAAVCGGRNATEYFEKARFQYSPARPDDALVFFVDNVSPFICEPQKAYACGEAELPDDGFCLRMLRGYSAYACSFEGNATTESNLRLIQQSVPGLFEDSGVRKLQFNEIGLFCTNDSQLPDEYFRLRVQRPHEDQPVKCLLHNDIGMLYLRFPGYPSILCKLGTEGRRYAFRGRYHFNVPGIADDPLKCVFRVYSELPLVDTHTEERLHQSLISSLPNRGDGVRPRIVCSRHGTSNGTVHFQLLLQSDATYDCSFPDAAPRHQPLPEKSKSEIWKVTPIKSLPPSPEKGMPETTKVITSFGPPPEKGVSKTTKVITSFKPLTEKSKSETWKVVPIKSLSPPPEKGMPVTTKVITSFEPPPEKGVSNTTKVIQSFQLPPERPYY